MASETKKKLDSSPKSGSAVNKTVKVKSKTTSSSSKTVAKTTTKVREKKVFTLPGQKYDIPEERDPLRLFYESLSKQIPTSEMAEFWLMEHGLLPADRAKKAYERKQAKQKKIRMGTLIKPQKPSNEPESSNKQQSKNEEIIKTNKNGSDDDDDEFMRSPKQGRTQDFIPRG